MVSHVQATFPRTEGLLDMLEDTELGTPQIRQIVEYVRVKVGVPFEHYQAWMHARQLEVRTAPTPTPNLATCAY